MRLAFLALLLAAPVGAVTPFSWTSTASAGSVQVAVPSGMVWHVEQISGYHVTTTATSSLPAVSIAEQGAGPNRSAYFSLPALALTDGTNRKIWTYSQAVNVSYRGVVTITAIELIQGVGPAIPNIPFNFAVAGYLSPTLAGDYSGDGVVNAADYTVLRDDAFEWEPSDMASWRSGYGAGVATALSIPEPATALLALLATIALPLRR